MSARWPQEVDIRNKRFIKDNIIFSTLKKVRDTLLRSQCTTDLSIEDSRLAILNFYID